MAKQTINQGTAPTGAGGDTFRSGSAKLQANDNELYTALGANASGVLPAALPVNKGGTGATTAATARSNLGLGTAATATLTTSSADLVTGRVLKVGDMGLGQTPINIEIGSRKLDSVDIGFAAWGEPIDNIMGIPRFSVGLTIRRVANEFTQLILPSTANGSAYRRVSRYDLEMDALFKFYDTSNTTVDSNGFIKAASPIAELYADRIELNDEAKLQAITFEKLGVGDYLIKGSTGFAQEGWYVEQPKDSNGNVFHAVVYDTLENGDISVKTYEQKMDGVKVVADLDKPVDIKENRFISIRLQELPQPEYEEPQPDPTITDSQGSPAPSHLHELVEGTWAISSENAAILENERLSAMPALTRRQFRLALAMNGYNLADIETLINSIEDPMQRQITMIEWQDATSFERLNPSLLSMADLMGLVSEQVDMLWNQALTL